MAGKVIKEAIIALSVCLLTMLIFALALYEFLPSRKVIPEVAKYTASEQITEQLADDVENRNDKVVLTYSVTANDLNNYKAKKEYIPGKSNPFSEAIKGSGTADETTAGKEDSSKSSSTENTTNTQRDPFSPVSDGSLK